jgi:hypothetical protein
MDALKLSDRMCGERDPSQVFLIVLYAAGHLLREFPRGLFFDDDLVWHQQQFGKEGHIAFAYVVRRGSRLYGLNYVSDIVQRISRRREYKTKVERIFRGWAEMILNSVVSFALETGVSTIYSPGADAVMANTDPKRHVHRELFERVYDRALRKQFFARKWNGWWVMDVAENRDRVVQGKKEEEVLGGEKTICVCHDIERGVGHLDVDPAYAAQADRNATRWLESMLEIEAKLDVKSTYNTVGMFFGEVRDKIEAGGHCIAFHSFDHRVEEAQLNKCRRVDNRIKGYRPPQSRLTPELNESFFCLKNFDWLASSTRSLGLDVPMMQNRVVKIPIVTDDFELYKRKIKYADWEDRLLKEIEKRSFAAFGLHDCYGQFWLPHYKNLLARIKDLGTLQTLNSVSDRIILQSSL